MYNVYVVLTGLEDKSKDIQRATLITCMGVKAARLLKQLPFEEDDDKENPNIVLQRMKDHFEGQRNVIVKRFRFFRHQQTNGERVEEYIVAL